VKRITVIGTGYLGAVHAASMASLGYEVLGMDVNSEKIAALAAGRTPFFEPGSMNWSPSRSPPDG
jgi:UDPglucose 6-dehydrogenase